MPKEKSIYPRGQLAKVTKQIISKYVGGIYIADEIIKQVKAILPEALEPSIRSLITYEYPKRGWALETEIHGEYKLTDNFGKKRSRKIVTGTRTEPPKGVIKTENDELTFVEIGRGIVSYMNELKTLADIAEEENVKLTRQVNKLQEAFNQMKLEEKASIHIRDILTF